MSEQDNPKLDEARVSIKLSILILFKKHTKGESLLCISGIKLESFQVGGGLYMAALSHRLYVLHWTHTAALRQRTGDGGVDVSPSYQKQLTLYWSVLVKTKLSIKRRLSAY